MKYFLFTLLFCGLLGCNILKLYNPKEQQLELNNPYGYFERGHYSALNDTSGEAKMDFGYFAELIKLNPVLGNKINFGGNKFSVAIEDANKNKVFNTKTDYLHLSGFGDKNIYRFDVQSNSVCRLKKVNYCKINDVFF